MTMLMMYDDCGDDDDDGDDQLQRLDGGRVPRKEQRMEEAFLQRSLVGTTPHYTAPSAQVEEGISPTKWLLQLVHC